MRGKARAQKGLLSKLLQSSGLGDSIFFFSTPNENEKEPRTGAKALSEGSCAQPEEQGSLRQVTGETKAHRKEKKSVQLEALEPWASPHPVGAPVLVGRGGGGKTGRGQASGGRTRNDPGIRLLSAFQDPQTRL